MTKPIPKFSSGFKRQWKTDEKIYWNVGGKFSTFKIEVPVGFEFESSSPYITKPIFSRNDPLLLPAAAIHDYLLEEINFHPPQAAAEWFDACIAYGVPEWKAKLGFLGVAFWSVYKLHN